VAVDVSDATDALASLVGLTTIEDVLDRLFSSFCIGK
jgi:tRNA U34 5-carboxymethylaminomethyl modifying GTPase MnmE/TrmE